MCCVRRTAEHGATLKEALDGRSAPLEKTRYVGGGSAWAGDDGEYDDEEEESGSDSDEADFWDDERLGSVATYQEALGGPASDVRSMSVVTAVPCIPRLDLTKTISVDAFNEHLRSEHELLSAAPESEICTPGSIASSCCMIDADSELPILRRSYRTPHPFESTHAPLLSTSHRPGTRGPFLYTPRMPSPQSCPPGNRSVPLARTADHFLLRLEEAEVRDAARSSSDTSEPSPSSSCTQSDDSQQSDGSAESTAEPTAKKPRLVRRKKAKRAAACKGGAEPPLGTD